jgi:hypothetical protein
MMSYLGIDFSGLNYAYHGLPAGMDAHVNRPPLAKVSRGRFRVVGCGAFRLDFDGGLGGEDKRRRSILRDPRACVRYPVSGKE